MSENAHNDASWHAHAMKHGTDPLPETTAKVARICPGAHAELVDGFFGLDGEVRGVFRLWVPNTDTRDELCQLMRRDELYTWVVIDSGFIYAHLSTGRPQRAVS